MKELVFDVLLLFCKKSRNLAKNARMNLNQYTLSYESYTYNDLHGFRDSLKSNINQTAIISNTSVEKISKNIVAICLGTFSVNICSTTYSGIP